jgi:uncharacterized protein (TIGR00645 family)
MDRHVSDPSLEPATAARHPAMRAPPGEPPTRVERFVGRSLFACRWLLAPFYLGLAVSLIVLLVKFTLKTIRLVTTAATGQDTEIITGVLSLIDVSLVASLLLMVMLAGYENFVSGFEVAPRRYSPSWMGHVSFGDLKVKVLTSIVAISAIHVLEGFMNIHDLGDRDLGWGLGIMVGFTLTGTLLAVMNRISGDAHE